jgi:hypothetical protein
MQSPAGCVVHAQLTDLFLAWSMLLLLLLLNLGRGKIRNCWAQHGLSPFRL